MRENQVRAASLLLGFPGDPLSLPVNDTLLTVARDRGYTEMRKLLEERLDGRGEAVGVAMTDRRYGRVAGLWIR